MVDLPPPVPAIEFRLSSTGMSKGLAQTDGPQLRVRGELSFGSVYVGGYVKNVDSSSSDGKAEALVGVRTHAAGLDLDVSAAWKRAIDPAPRSQANALEIESSASRKLGRFTPKVSLTWSPDALGSTGRDLFAETDASWRLTNSFSASAAMGWRRRSGGADYSAWNAGFSWKPAKSFMVDARYYDTDGGDSSAYRARMVVSARLRF